MTADSPILLTPEEEITLRRVAFGESTVRSMRAQDLARLRSLRLIADAKDGPVLTANGRRHFEELPKAPMLLPKTSNGLASAAAKTMKQDRNGG